MQARHQILISLELSFWLQQRSETRSRPEISSIQGAKGIRTCQRWCQWVRLKHGQDSCGPGRSHGKSGEPVAGSLASHDALEEAPFQHRAKADPVDPIRQAGGPAGNNSMVRCSITSK